jgi:hypothetical protein
LTAPRGQDFTRTRPAAYPDGDTNGSPAFANVLNGRSEKTRFLNANFAPLSMAVRHPAPDLKEGFMVVRSAALWAMTLGAISVAAPISGAHALTMKECSAKYKAAQDSGALKGMKWNDFRKAECGTGASALPSTAPAATPAAGAAPPATTTAARPAATAPARPSDAVFPSAVAQKYSTESAGKARMHTCLDQYNANKTGTGNGGLKWIQKGGGYYSECNKRLKV